MKPPRIRTGEPKMEPKPKPARPAKPRAARPTLAQVKRVGAMRAKVMF